MKLFWTPLVFLLAACSTTPAPDTEGATASIQPNEAQTGGPAIRMKLAQTIDRTGFERAIPSASMLIPADWSSQGLTQWTQNRCNPTSTTFRAESPSGHGFEVFPEHSWKWADNGLPDSGGCEVMRPLSAAEYFRANIDRARPGAKVASLEPLPNALAELQQQARVFERQAAQYGLRERMTPDLVRATIRYETTAGIPVEEWIVVKTVTIALSGPFGVTYTCTASAIAERAPAGQLEASEKLFNLMLSTIRVNPDWQRRYDAVMGNVTRAEQQGTRDRADINRRTAEDLRNLTRQSYESQQRSQDSVYSQYSESLRGVDTYRNPHSGETIELSNDYGNAWVNNRGEYLLSDQPGFDPGVALQEQWTPLQRIRR